MKNADRITVHWTDDDFPDYVEIVVNGRSRVYVDRQRVNQSWLDALRSKKITHA